MKTVAQETQDAFEERDIDGFYIWYHDNKQRLLEKEKQQIIEAYKEGAYNYNGRQSEDYYNETFNK